MFYNDYETQGLIAVYDRVMGTSLIDPAEHEKLAAHIRERREMVRRGVLRCPTWFQEELNKLDPKLRAWWDAWAEKWVIDRLQDEGYYLTILQFKPGGNFHLDRTLLDAMRANDMQRYARPSDYLKAKREAADKKRKENEAKASEKVRAAVDALSSKSIEQFIAVEQAIQSGETILAHGDDAATLEKAQNAQRQALARGELPQDDERMALNPGMHPQIYQRERKDP